VGESSSVTVSFTFKMELGRIAPREYHEKTGRLVRKDKIYTDEEKKKKKKAKTAAWRLENPRAR
jgi:hypothetical protein